MHPALQLFARQYLGVIFATLLPVLVVTFLSIPLNLNGHPGEARIINATTYFHLT
ncbi:hypothetical protein [Herbaspirillum sp. RV1423]|uniref:hypothetical protein n=1 Tax=Herbaspirillum sp. RV1423 TaxID=1443993 RepID=UPI0012DDA365|nr:hypothetical protein [Herbaspirillum sp. RV1423]